MFKQEKYNEVSVLDNLLYTFIYKYAHDICAYYLKNGMGPDTQKLLTKEHFEQFKSNSYNENCYTGSQLTINLAA